MNELKMKFHFSENKTYFSEIGNAAEGRIAI